MRVEAGRIPFCIMLSLSPPLFLALHKTTRRPPLHPVLDSLDLPPSKPFTSARPGNHTDLSTYPLSYNPQNARRHLFICSHFPSLIPCISIHTYIHTPPPPPGSTLRRRLITSSALASCIRNDGGGRNLRAPRGKRRRTVFQEARILLPWLFLFFYWDGWG